MRVALGLATVLAVAWVSAGPASAQALDPASAAALAATLQLLQDPAKRGAAIGGNPQADPAGFVARLSPQTAERLRTFAAKIQKR